MELKLDLSRDETILKIDVALLRLSEDNKSNTDVNFTYSELKEYRKLLTLEHVRQELAAKTLRDALEFRKKTNPKE